MAASSNSGRRATRGVTASGATDVLSSATDAATGADAATSIVAASSAAESLEAAVIASSRVG